MYPESNQPVEGTQHQRPYPTVQPPQNAAFTPYGPPSELPPTPPAPRSRRPLFILAGIVVAALVLVGGGTVAVLRANNVGPFKDSGLAACEAIRDSKTKGSSNSNDKMTAAKYREMRKPFADSRYADIRDSGTKFVDLAWQFAGSTGQNSNNNDGSLGMALVAVGQLFQSYSSLSGACANHGVTLPPISAN